jgi:hypothetical protein
MVYKQITQSESALHRQNYPKLALALRIENWLRHQGRAGLTPCDRPVLTPAFARLGRDASNVAALAEDLITEMHAHDRAKAQ